MGKIVRGGVAINHGVQSGEVDTGSPQDCTTPKESGYNRQPPRGLEKSPCQISTSETKSTST
jgi:hypothetical protein